MPTLKRLVDKRIDEKINHLWTAAPAKVLSVSGRTATVQVKGKLYNPDTMDTLIAPIVQEVPIWQYKAGNSRILLPVQADDIVLLVFSKIGLSQLLRNTSIVESRVANQFRLQDAIVLPGLFVETDDDSLPTNRMELWWDDNTKITVDGSGRFLFYVNGSISGYIDGTGFNNGSP